MEKLRRVVKANGVDVVNSRENVRFAECFALTFLSALYTAFVRDCMVRIRGVCGDGKLRFSIIDD